LTNGDGWSESAATASAKSERAKSVTSFYHQFAIDQTAAKASVRLMPATMLYSGKSADGSHILRSCQYLHKELPVRLAHRIAGFRGLPFIVGCNPTILSIHEMFIRAFHMVADFPFVANLEDEQKFCRMLSDLLQDHREVVTLLAEGFNETRKHIQDEALIKSFLDQTLTSRLGMRLLCEHHLLLHHDQAGQVGVIHVNFSPKSLIERKAEFTRKMCEQKYGVSPEVKVAGHTHAQFSYIPQPLDYIMHEMLKNAMRATVEFHGSSPNDRLPPIVVTIANNPVDFIVRISDRGGGIRHDLVNKVWNYGFSSASGKEVDEANSHADAAGGMFEAMMNSRSFGSMFGYGFGLPACRAYVEYLGGELSLETLQGFGTDVYIRLRHIDGKMESFRI
jgi:[3-methyl-2-oxobutanoate dehydrogenase (acetyl-transferring)] kinase